MDMKQITLMVSLVLLCLAATPGEAAAAGFFLPGHGVKPMGRGGAFVTSGGGDLNSLWHNPANLAGMEALTLTVDLALIDLAFEFQRAPMTNEDGSVTQFDRVSNEAAPITNPQLLIGGPLPIKGLSWAFGIYAPYMTSVTFPEDGPQRYTLIDNAASLLAYQHLAIGYQLNDSVRVGVGIQNLASNFVLVNKISAYTGVYGRPEDPDLDILTRITMRKMFTPSGNFGVWVKLLPVLNAALSVQLPAHINIKDAPFETKLPDNPFFANAEVKGDTLQGKLLFPLMVRLGLGLELEKFDYELAVVYENWSAFDEIQASPNDVTVEGVPGVGSIAVAPLTVPLGYRDTFSVRNGMELDISSAIQARAGYIYESSAVPDEFYSVFLADSTKHVFTLGGTYATEGWELDAGFAYHLMPSRSISNSQMRQINPTDPTNENTTIVGNGDYSQRYMLFGAGFTKRF